MKRLRQILEISKTWKKHYRTKAEKDLQDKFEKDRELSDKLQGPGDSRTKGGLRVRLKRNRMGMHRRARGLRLSKDH